MLLQTLVHAIQGHFVVMLAPLVLLHLLFWQWGLLAMVSSMARPRKSRSLLICHEAASVCTIGCRIEVVQKFLVGVHLISRILLIIHVSIEHS